MPQLKPLIGKPVRGIPSKSGDMNFFFSQDSSHLKRKWGNKDDFWSATRPGTSNEPPQWSEFESWQSDKKSKD